MGPLSFARSTALAAALLVGVSGCTIRAQLPVLGQQVPPFPADQTFWKGWYSCIQGTTRLTLRTRLLAGDRLRAYFEFAPPGVGN